MTNLKNINTARKEGITIKYGLVTNPALRSGLDKLDQFREWTDPKDIFRFSKFKGFFDREEKKAMIWYKALIDKHSERIPIQKKSPITGKMEDQYDAKGKPLTRPKQGPGNNGQITIQMKDQALFNKAIKEFDNHPFTVKVFRFKADDLVKAGLTPLELRGCARLIDDLPEEFQINENEDDEILREELQDELDGDHDELEASPEEDIPPPNDEPLVHGGDGQSAPQ